LCCNGSGFCGHISRSRRRRILRRHALHPPRDSTIPPDKTQPRLLCLPRNAALLDHRAGDTAAESCRPLVSVCRWDCARQSQGPAGQWRERQSEPHGCLPVDRFTYVGEADRGMERRRYEQRVQTPTSVGVCTLCMEALPTELYGATTAPALLLHLLHHDLDIGRRVPTSENAVGCRGCPGQLSALGDCRPDDVRRIGLDG
jgi:hypothetical protein